MPQLPVVDISPLLEPGELTTAFFSEPRRQVVSQELFAALNDVGFLYICQHGVDLGLQQRLESLAHGFFSLSEEEKMRIRMENVGRAWKGYFPVGAELTSGRPDQKEGLYFGKELSAQHPLVRSATPMHGPNQWPAFRQAEFRSTVMDYMQSMTDLGARLLAAVAVGMGLNPNYFATRFTREPTTLFRIFNYPPRTWDDEDDEWSVREHTDMGFLTILKQDTSGGLQVRRRNGVWVDAEPIPDTFVINIGDMLELWTWGILRATLHRVRNPGQQDRLSYPFFYDPAWQSTLERIDQNLLADDLRSRAGRDAETRWDELDLAKLSATTTYGEFVWAKIRRVFPQLDQ